MDMFFLKNTRQPPDYDMYYETHLDDSSGLGKGLGSGAGHGHLYPFVNVAHKISVTGETESGAGGVVEWVLSGKYEQLSGI